MPTPPLAMKPERGTIAIYFVHQALRCLALRGVDAEPLLLRAGIPAAFVREPLARVSPEQFGLLWRDIARTLDDEFFGLDAHPMRVGSYALMCAAALPCANLRHALKRIVHFMGLVLDDLRGELIEQGGQAEIRLMAPRGASARATAQPLFAHATWFIMVWGLACWLVGRRLTLQTVQFAAPAPLLVGGSGSVENEYRVLFCEALHFDQPLSSLSFAASALDLPLIQTPESLRNFLSGAPANFLVKYRNPNSLAARIRRRLREQPPADWPAFEQLCAQWHFTEATLRRRLRDEGHTYQSIKDDLRRDQAIAWLQTTRRSLPDIAAALGFAEPSAFHRAFKKWTGGRPSDYRGS